MVESFSRKMNGRTAVAGKWAKNLKVGQAFVNLVSVIPWLIGWLAGFIFFVLKFLVGLIVVGFQEGRKK